MRRRRSVALGLLAGAAGGALGTLVLNLFQKASLEGTRVAENKLDSETTYTQQQEGLLKSFEEAHTRTAVDLAHAAGTDLSSAQRAKAAPVTEFAFGILCAGVYGMLAEYLPAVTVGFGSVYGAVLFTGASEVVLPAIGYVAAAKDRTPVQHLGGLAGNVVYGMCTEGVRRLIRSK